jgi:hypothetical protein
MAFISKSSAERTTRWDVMVSNLKPSLAEMPFVAADLDELEEVLARTRALEALKADLRSQARQANAEIKVMLHKGDRLRSRLSANLKGKLGFSDPTLAKYGIRPRSTVVRRRKAGGTPPPTPPSAEPSPATEDKP